MPTHIPEIVRNLGPEAAKEYAEAPERELTMPEWIAKTEQWIIHAMGTFKNHQESIEAVDARLKSVEALELERRVSDLENLFRSAEEQAKRKNPNPSYAQ